MAWLPRKVLAKKSAAASDSADAVTPTVAKFDRLWPTDRIPHIPDRILGTVAETVWVEFLGRTRDGARKISL
jgi:hypothetical protein